MTGSGALENARYFDGLAGRWDSLMAMDPVKRSVIEASLAALCLSPGNTVLDAGAGTGFLFPFLLPAIGPEGKLIALDVSSAMLNEARRKFPAPNISFVCRDVESFLDCARPDSVEAVACFQAFPHFENQKRMIEGFCRILKPGGRLGIFHADDSASLNAFHATLPDPVNRHRLPAAERVRDWAIAAGLAVTEAREMPGLYRLTAVKPPLK